MRARLLLIAVLAVVAAATSFAATAALAGGPTPRASGHQNISSGPGVYAQTTDEYAGSWSWAQLSASYDYYWYIFRSTGVLVANGHNPTGGGGSWNGAPNIYYFKEYNNEPSGSGHVNILGVDYCC
jgi:hypothetical protein